MNKYRFLRKSMIIIALIIIILLICFSYFEKNIKNIVYDLAKAQVRAMATNAFNDAVSEIFSNSANNDDLISIILDNDGKVTMINADTVKMNKLASETALLAQDKISGLEDSGVYIPFGSMFNSQLLSGRGPKIKIKIVPVGSVSTQFVTEFQQAGINQTRLKIYLLATTQVNIVIPTGTSLVEVSSYVPISENIIIGDVPESFVMIEDDELLNLVPD